MTTKRPSLAESMQKAAVADEPTPTAPPKVSEHPAAATIETDGRPKAFYAATRAGKKKITATVSPAGHKQFKGLAVERETTTEALMAEAINDLFKKYGKQPNA